MKTIPLFWPLPMLLWAVSHLFVSFSYASGSDFLGTTRPDPEEFPIQVQFTTMVDQLRLREAPGPDARVLATLPENTALTYLHQTAGPETEVVLRGKKVKGRWRKVRCETNVRGEGWVFAGGLSLRSVVQVAYSEVPFDSIRFDFMRVEKISKKKFEAFLDADKNKFVADIAEHTVSETSFVLKFENGRQKMISDSLCNWRGINPDLPPHDDFGYLGQYPELGLYKYYSNCEHGEIIAGTTHYYVSKYDGTMQFEMDGGGDIAISPDNRWVANVFSGDCGSMTGLEFARQDGRGSWDWFYLEWSDLYARELVWTDRPGELAAKFVVNTFDNEENLPEQYYRIVLNLD